MKNKKLKLDELKVQSFLTSMTQKERNTIHGAAESDNCYCTEGGAEACTDADCLPVPGLETYDMVGRPCFGAE